MKNFILVSAHFQHAFGAPKWKKNVPKVWHRHTYKHTYVYAPLVRCWIGCLMLTPKSISSYVIDHLHVLVMARLANLLTSQETGLFKIGSVGTGCSLLFCTVSLHVWLQVGEKKNIYYYFAVHVYPSNHSYLFSQREVAGDACKIYTNFRYIWEESRSWQGILLGEGEGGKV